MDYKSSESSGKTSYNDAEQHIFRRNELKIRLIDTKITPFSFNENYGAMNYIVRMSTLISLWSETRQYCTDEQKELMDKMKMILDNYPSPIQTFTIEDQDRQIINYEVWDSLNTLLNMFEDKIRALEHIYGLDNPLKSRDDDI